ncbi:response regulator transcription factor [Conexibacter woesei]|uniref:Transcriptional regulator, LuxR family n=1 Tax=Conexibacter woesei (strain DSM 14684 / CCUG 47730 / CIP 108061 / JCM 11494 / NBRC 100937 / ID131577) TaxID=469383 RepID=D3F986_CONWI|nr:response regulator transcription factor [Conexibacter woesei]ADB49053.1 transcriptional regulator, LuxR family [Conexibacter woesei DSM 14684]
MSSLADRRLTVLVVDREELALWGFSLVLQRQTWVRRCAVANDLATARKRVAELPVDVVAVDGRFGDDALSALQADLRAISPCIRVVLTVDASDRTLPPLPTIDRTWPVARLLTALRAAGLDDTAPIHRPPSPTRLSERERQVLTLVSEGSTNAQIGRSLCLSPHTIKQHTSSVYRKLHARNRAEAVTRARELGLLV